MEKILFTMILQFLAVWLHLQGASLAYTLNKKFNLSTNRSKSNMYLSFLTSETEYRVSREYDFYIPEVEVVCQCSCTHEKYYSCSLDRDCAGLANSSTSCTIFITIDNGLSFCNTFYKLCCQVYFSKAKMMKSFKALEVKYHQSLLKFRIFSKSPDGHLNTYNVTIAENMKHLLISPDKVLNVHNFLLAQHVPDKWYFIEYGSDELLYSDAMNEIDELDMSKIGWFQSKGNGLSRVKRDDLEKQLQVKLLDCNSNPPMYEWKLNAISYISKGLFHMPKSVERVSQMYKDISKISVDISGRKLKVAKVAKSSSVNITVVDASLYPFIFTISIKESVFNLTFTKGNGNFDVEITSPLWTDTLSLSASFPGKIIKLPTMNYDSSWVCVSQKGQKLCQISPLKKYEVYSITTSSIVGLNYNSQMDVKKHVTEFPMNTISSISENPLNMSMVIIIAFLVPFPVGLLVIQVLKIWRRMHRKESDVRDRIEMEPLTPDYRGVLEQVEQNLRRRNEKKRLLNRSLGESYMNLELHNRSGDNDETKGEPMELDELFNPIDGEDPVRILVKGERGYGTTLSLTLLNDWGKMRNYVSPKFKMVFLFELKDLKENFSIDAMLKRECQAVGVNDNDGIECILAYESETLLILDGFDEINDECKRKVISLINRDLYPNMFIVVTSETGKFEVEKNKKGGGGYFESNNDDVKSVNIWHKRVLIKRVKSDNVEDFT